MKMKKKTWNDVLQITENIQQKFLSTLRVYIPKVHSRNVLKSEKKMDMCKSDQDYFEGCNINIDESEHNFSNTHKYANFCIKLSILYYNKYRTILIYFILFTGHF